MKKQWTAFFLLVAGSSACAQEPARLSDANPVQPGYRELIAQPQPAKLPDTAPAQPGYREIIAQPQQDFHLTEAQYCNQRNLLQGDRDFQNFIGFVSNPTLSLDPRALSQIWPVFGNTWTVAQNRIPAGDLQMYGPGLSVALGDRVSFGLSKGGYVVSNIRNSREGFLDLGGFAQVAIIRNVERQFILTAGMQVQTTWLGSSQLFQGGNGPALLSPYLTFGKEIGAFHILGTAGYQFPTGTDTVTTRTAYANLHFDRRCFGWLYPLVEFNGAWHDHSINAPRLDAISGFFDLGRFDAAGSMVTVAPGVNAVIVPNRLELGAVYQTPIYSENNFRFHEVLVKMILRY